MKRSVQVSAPLLAAVALGVLTGCRKPEMQRCVDQNNKVVDPSFCKNLPPAAGQPGYNNGGYNNGGGGMMFIPYHYYYGGGGGYGIGSSVYGGGYAPLSGHSYSSSSTTRGGFGSSMSGSHGSSGSGGE